MQPLFERLTKSMVSRSRAKHHTIESLKQSVIAEIARILSTRSYFSEVGSTGPDILSFGAPRTANFSASNCVELEQLRVAIEEAIRQFEPRLHRPSVVMNSDAGTVDSASMTVSGYLQLGEETELVSFPLSRTAVAA